MTPLRMAGKRSKKAILDCEGPITKEMAIANPNNNKNDLKPLSSVLPT